MTGARDQVLGAPNAVPTAAGQASPSAEGRRAITAQVAGEHVALALEAVRDVFVPTAVTRVPLAPPSVLGLVGVRGHPLPALCLRRLLDLPPPEPGAPALAIHVAPREDARSRDGAEACALIVDAVGEVVTLARDTRRAVPPHLRARWGARLSAVHLHGDRLLTVLDLDALLAAESGSRAA